MCFRTTWPCYAMNLPHVRMTHIGMAEYPSSVWGARNTTVAWLAGWYECGSSSSHCVKVSTSSPLANGMGGRQHVAHNPTATTSQETVMMSSTWMSLMHTCHPWTPAMWLRASRS